MAGKKDNWMIKPWTSFVLNNLCKFHKNPQKSGDFVEEMLVRIKQKVDAPQPDENKLDMNTKDFFEKFVKMQK